MISTTSKSLTTSQTFSSQSRYLWRKLQDTLNDYIWEGDKIGIEPSLLLQKTFKQNPSCTSSPMPVLPLGATRRNPDDPTWRRSLRSRVLTGGAQRGSPSAGQRPHLCFQREELGGRAGCGSRHVTDPAPACSVFSTTLKLSLKIRGEGGGRKEEEKIWQQRGVRWLCVFGLVGFCWLFFRCVF